MCATPKSSTYGALHPKPCVQLKNLIDHFVPYNPLNKLSVHHNCELWGQYFSSYIIFSLRVTRETKIFANFNKNSIFFM